MTQKKISGFLVFFIGWVLAAGFLAAQDKPADPGLTLERIFAGREFAAERFGPARWMRDGETYVTLEPGVEAKTGRYLVLYRAETGKREVLVSAAGLIPAGASEPLAIEDYAWSPDGKVLIVFTNSKRVWRQNTRGDFWTYDLASGRLRRLGQGFKPSTLMFAKLSPDGRKAAYVVNKNIYAEDLASGKITQLTFDGGDDIINGTSDWVNEEEFGIRDGFRWSPDSAFIAYWQFDTSRVPVFSMINNTDSLYPKVTSFKHPKPGQTNSAVKIGVVPVAGGYPVWVRTPGDPSDTYIPRLEWAGNSR
ncbi:MAG: DPP IV N-terminal domain-containing protein, partial [Candidatus Aminicenantes bacterium]|nr:DPP IV N-terminal domain-containing protein [Candidatus Aminicenantes bacterium]